MSRARVAPCWCTRVIVESIDTTQSNRPAASDCFCTYRVQRVLGAVNSPPGEPPIDGVRPSEPLRHIPPRHASPVVREFGSAVVRRRLHERFAQTQIQHFAERFVAGREFNVSLLAESGDVRVLPPAEIDFSAFPPDKPAIVGYAAKWNAASAEYQQTPRTFDFSPTDQPLLTELARLAVACWRRFELRGYARVDFRVDRAGQPWILELNANPCLSPDAGFAAALLRDGVSFDQAVANILADATVAVRKERSEADDVDK